MRTETLRYRRAGSFRRRKGWRLPGRAVPEHVPYAEFFHAQRYPDRRILLIRFTDPTGWGVEAPPGLTGYGALLTRFRTSAEALARAPGR
jgi:hypothetical protein